MPPPFDGESDLEEIQAAVGKHLAAVDPNVTPFRLRNRYRSGVGTWIVSVAVPAGHRYQADALMAAAKALGMRVEGFFEYRGDLQSALWREEFGEPPTRDGLPLTNEDQACAFCGDEAPSWVHPLDPRKTEFRTAKGMSMLPTFWTVCRSCEELLASGTYDQLARVIVRASGDALPAAEQVVQVFRDADLGPRAILHVPVPD